MTASPGLIPVRQDVPTRLRIEHGPRPLGAMFRRPRLSWWLPLGTDGQLSYQVRATIDGAMRTAEPAEARESLLRPWPFPGLRSRSRVSWQVRVRSVAGWSDWSAAAEFETGLLDPADWHARFIGIADPDPGSPRGQRGALFLRRRFTVSEPPARARAYATAQGRFELYLDGTRIGDLGLTPGRTASRSRLEVQAYDITALCGPGEHELVAAVTDGWRSGTADGFQLDQGNGTTLALLAQVELFDQAGGRWSIATGGGWQAAASGLASAADPVEGPRAGPAIPFLPQSGWHKAVVLGARLSTLPHTGQD
jgi:alpha-L-rhamnosidase